MLERYESESIGSLPLVFGLLEYVDLSTHINSTYPSHKNWSGGNKGIIVSVWLCYILTLTDHRLCGVEDWFVLHKRSLNLLLVGYGHAELDAKDFTDDRLGSLLSAFGAEDVWNIFMSSFTCNLLKLYNISVKSVELDATIAQQYRSVIDDGLLQMGHSKQHRRDLPQFKSMLSNASEHNIPLLINTVSGNRADDVLYAPLIAQTRAMLGSTGILWQGDSKLGSLENRYEIARHADFYLTPASLVQLNAQTLRHYIATHTASEGAWTTIYLDKEVKGTLEKVAIGTGFELSVALSHKDFNWTERRLVVRSTSYAAAETAVFNKQLHKAQAELADLMTRKQGKAVHKSADDLLKAAKKITDKNHVTRFFDLHVLTTITHKTVNGYKKNANRTLEIQTFDLQIEQNLTLIDQNRDYLGYRVYLTNQTVEHLDIQKAVEAYRGEYKIERRIRNLKQEVCALLPIYLQKDDRIVGLVNLLTLLLQIVSIAEYQIAQSLKEEEQENQKKIAGLYAGQPKLATAKPSISKIITAMSPITIIFVIKDDKVVKKVITNQNHITKRIIELIKIPLNPYEILML